MPIKKNQQLNNKSGLYFVLFILGVGLFLVYYFSTNNIENQNNNSNQNQDTQIQAENVNKKNSVNKNKNNNSNQNQNINNNININQAVGGENIDTSENELGLTVVGYNSVVKSQNGDITNLDLADGNSISIMPLSYEGIVKNSIGINSESNITVDGHDAVKYTGSSAKDGSKTSFVLVKKDDKLYHFKGLDSFLDNLDNFIKF